MSFEVHREPLYRRYYAPTASISCCYSVLWGFMLIVLPLFIAYNTSIFWTDELLTYEQPSAKYRYQTLLEITGSRSDSNDPVNIYYSTSPSINALYSNSLRIPVLQSASFDDNRDGKTDRLEINVQMPIRTDESIHGLSALVYFNIELSSKVRYLFDSVCYIHFESMSAMTELEIDGDLIVKQMWPLDGKGGYKVPYSNDPLIEVDAGISAKDVSIAAIMRNSNARNLSTVFAPSYEYIAKAGGGSGKSSMIVTTGGTTASLFNASLTIRIPTQPFRYTPTASVVLSNAWVVYMSFFVVVAFLLFRLNSLIFRNQLLTTYPVADIVYEKMD